MNHFRIRLAGRTDWMDLYRSDIDLKDSKALLDEDLNPLEEMEEFTEELIYSLKEAACEAAKQFQGKGWDLSNGEVLIAKRGTERTKTTTSMSIFDTGKVPMPDYGVKVVRRAFDGSLSTKKVFSSEKSFGKFDRMVMAGAAVGLQ